MLILQYFLTKIRKVNLKFHLNPNFLTVSVKKKLYLLNHKTNSIKIEIIR